MEAELAEAQYETARSDYRAVCLEADMVLESCRNARAEMANLEPALRVGPLGRGYAGLGDLRQQPQMSLPANTLSPADPEDNSGLA
jgi:hypothetical protein